MLSCRCKSSKDTIGPNTPTYHCCPWTRRPYCRTQMCWGIPSQRMTNMHPHSAQSRLVASQSMADGSTCAGTSISATWISKSQLQRKVRYHNAAIVASNAWSHTRFTRPANSVCRDSGATHDACSHNKLSRSDRVHPYSRQATLNLPLSPHLNIWDAEWWLMTVIPWQ